MPAKASTKKTVRIILVPHTHWDREWYFPYQRYRTRLVGFFDLLLDILENDPAYKHFNLDGHAILVEDYLEVRPDRREEIERLVRNGRLAVGPWYVIPDETLPSGEALVRNILRGHRIARQLGRVQPVGYIPDPFGQIAHMPAIWRGFGIDRTVFWRGVDASLKHTELIWESPDGSAVLAVHMPGGYGVAGPFPTEAEPFIEKVEMIRAMLEPRALTRTMFLPWGSDHVPPQRELPSLIRKYNTRKNGATIVHGTIPQLFDEVAAQTNGSARGGLAKLPRHRGEFRRGQFAHLLPGVISARMWIKQRTFECEQALTRWAEPLTLWSDLLRDRLGEAWVEPPRTLGAPSSPIPHEPLSESGLIDRAWRLLLENQPHDSICGCSIDQTHDEMRPRFDQCEQIAEDLTYQAMRRIGANGPAERVYVFNPLPGERSDYAEAVVPARRGQVPVALIDERGRRWPSQALADQSLAGAGARDRVAVGFVAGDVPGFGYRTFEVEYAPAPQRRSRSKTARRIENDSCIVEADPKDGTLRVEINGVGVRFTGLNRLADGGDRGDEYNYSAPDRDVLIDRPASPPRIRVIEDGPARSTLEIKMTYRLPAALGKDRRRLRRLVACPVRVLVSLYDGAPRIDVRTEFENNAADHRLRAHFPSGVTTDVSHAEQHFGVVTRPIALPEYDDTWVERPVPTHPQKTFVDVNGRREAGARQSATARARSNVSGGLLIANRGLPEYEVIDGWPQASLRRSATARARSNVRGATIALTLLRSVGWLSRNDYPDRKGHAGPPLETPDAQCRGRHVFEYSIIPHAGTWANAYEHAHAFASPMRARWNPKLRNNGGEIVEHNASLPRSASLVEVEGRGIVVSALKRAEDGRGVIVRLYNTLDKRTTGRLRLNERYRRCDVVDMKEDRLTKAELRDGWARLSLRPNEIVTLRFR